MRDNAATARASALPGVIDSLGTGFSILNRVLWVILIPIVLDAVLWVAPRVSIAPLVDRWSVIYRSAFAQATALAPTDTASTQSIDQAGALVDGLRTWASGFNLLSLLTTNVTNALVPSLGGAVHMDSAGVVNIGGIGSFVGLVVLLQLASVLLGCLYLVLIAQAVTGVRLSVSSLVSRVGRAWLNAVGYGAVILAVALVVSVPLGILVTLVSMVAPVVAGLMYALIFTAAWVVGIWMLLYLYFVAAGIVVGGLGPLKAIGASVGVVRRHFWASLGLVFLTLVITLGMGVIWEQLTSQPWGYGLAAVGNAYVASGLLAAALYFYWHRSGLAGRANQQPAATAP